MSHHIVAKQHTRAFKTHMILGAVLIIGGLTLAFHPSLWPFLATVGAISVTVHLGGAIVLLGGAMLVVTAIHRFMARRAAQNPDSPGATIRWAWFYDVLVKTLTFGRERAMRNAILDVARVSAGDSVLDVGCGTGTLALAASERVGANGSVYGVDAAAEMVARAKLKAQRAALPVMFQVAPAQSLPFDSHRFDVVFCTLVLHHLPLRARAQAVTEIRRVLKPGGRLIVVEIGTARGLWAAFNPVALLHGHDAKHIVTEVEELLRHAGFEQIHAAPLGFGVLDRVLAR